MNFLVKRGHKHYKPSLTHSLYYKLEKGSPVTGFPEECEVKKGYTHSSFIPRYLKIKYSKQLVGYKFPVHEVRKIPDFQLQAGYVSKLT